MCHLTLRADGDKCLEGFSTSDSSRSVLSLEHLMFSWTLPLSPEKRDSQGCKHASDFTVKPQKEVRSIRCVRSAQVLSNSSPKLFQQEKTRLFLALTHWSRKNSSQNWKCCSIESKRWNLGSPPLQKTHGARQRQAGAGPEDLSFPPITAAQRDRVTGHFHAWKCSAFRYLKQEGTVQNWCRAY